MKTFVRLKIGNRVAQPARANGCEPDWGMGLTKGSRFRVGRFRGFGCLDSGVSAGFSYPEVVSLIAKKTLNKVTPPPETYCS